MNDDGTVKSEQKISDTQGNFGGALDNDDLFGFSSAGISDEVTNGTVNVVTAGIYTVSETSISGYNATFSDDCDATGTISISAGENKTCTITNTFIKLCSNCIIWNAISIKISYTS